MRCVPARASLGLVPLFIVLSACSAADGPGGFQLAYNPHVGETCEEYVDVKERAREGVSTVPDELPLPAALELMGASYDDAGSTTYFDLTGDFDEAAGFLKTTLSDSAWSDGGWSGGDDPSGSFVRVLIHKGKVRGEVTLVKCQDGQALLVRMRERP